MNDTQAWEYFAHRAVQEREAAAKATSAPARMTHLEMAETYHLMAENACLREASRVGTATQER